MNNQSYKTQWVIYAFLFLILSGGLLFFVVRSSFAGNRAVTTLQSESLGNNLYLPVVSKGIVTVNPNAACIDVAGVAASHEAESSQYSSNILVQDDSAASGNRYLAIPNANFSSQTFIEMCFNVTQANWYTIKGFAGNSNTWVVEVDGQASEWSPSSSNRFTASDISRVYWETGTHSIRFKLRDADLSLDKVDLVGDPIAEPTDTPPTNSETILRINTGWSQDFVDANGNTWSADTGYVGGNTVSHDFEIQGGPEEVFTHERWGMDGYRFPVGNGQYLVKLLFAETYVGMTGPGQRLFEVQVENQNTGVIDVFEEAGGRNIVMSRDLTVNVEDFELTISFNNIQADAMIKGIEVIQLGEVSDPLPPTPTPQPTATPDPGAGPEIPTPTPIPGGQDLRAFPGAEGYGARETRGGRGGRVIEVTNLNNSGSGSLRACVEASGPRTCIFRVGGTIELDSAIRINNPYLTIAGQTAPGGGITLKNNPSNDDSPLNVQTHDVIIRYIRSRPGASNFASANGDAITIGSQTPGRVYNIIIDHSSFSWATDEVVNTWYEAKNITVQWSIMSEGLHCSSHPKGCHSKGMLLGSEGGANMTVHHNLFAHNHDRNPQVAIAGPTDIVNNIIYTPQNEAITLRDEYGRNRTNIVGNMVIAPNNAWGVDNYSVINGGYSVYLKDNISEQRDSFDKDESLFADPDSRGAFTNSRHDTPQVTTTSPWVAYDQVLASVGAVHGVDGDGNFYERRDSVDKRIIEDTRNRTGGIINDPSQVGGWPFLEPGTPYADADGDGMGDPWENRYFGNTNRGSQSDSSGDFDGDGYTDLEEFLNGTDPTVAGS